MSTSSNPLLPPTVLRRRSADRLRPLASALALPEQHLGAIRQSHERCVALGLSRTLRPDHAPLGRADLGLVRERHQRLHAHAAPVMEMLFGQIEGTQSMVVLCDSAGTIIHSIGDDDFLSRAAKVALQPGVNWSEPTKGTNAVGTALIEELPTLVHADEHYLHANHFLTCSAAPIFDPRGNVLGVLDVSGDHRSYHAHTMALVTLSARMIENQWLGDDHRHALRLHFHRRPEFIGTLMEGILAVAPDGRVLGANRGAQEQLGLSGVAVRMQTLQSLFGTTVGALVDHFRAPTVQPWVVRSQRGQAFHLRAQFSGPPWSRGLDMGASAVPSAPQQALSAPLPQALPAPRGPGQAMLPASGLAALHSGDVQMTAVLNELQRVRDHGVPVVLLGETGTGKDVLARALHHDSPRAVAHFVAVPCAAVSATELETAVQRAEGGTLYLDGVGELPPALQAQLLHRLDEPAFGLICASSQALRAGAGPGDLREDLFHRLQGLTVTLPPLRQRGDLPEMAQRMLDNLAHPRLMQLTAATLAQLAAGLWPGNLRQLQRVLRTAALLAEPGNRIEPRHLPADAVAGPVVVPGAGPAVVPVAAPVDAPTAPAFLHRAQTETLQQTERRAMEQALHACGGNVSQAARRLGVSRNTLYRRLRGTLAATP